MVVVGRAQGGRGEGRWRVWWESRRNLSENCLVRRRPCSFVLDFDVYCSFSSQNSRRSSTARQPSHLDRDRPPGSRRRPTTGASDCVPLGPRLGRRGRAGVRCLLGSSSTPKLIFFLPCRSWNKWATLFAKAGYSSLLLSIDPTTAKDTSTSQALLSSLETGTHTPSLHLVLLTPPSQQNSPPSSRPREAPPSPLSSSPPVPQPSSQKLTSPPTPSPPSWFTLAPIPHQLTCSTPTCSPPSSRSSRTSHTLPSR